MLKIVNAQDYLDVAMNGAILSKDRTYRYLLTRKLSFVKNICLFVMLNPSTADETANDPTVTRCINFAKYWGFGRLEVCNIFAYRATNPRELYTQDYIVGQDNDMFIRGAISRANRVVCAWGNHGTLKGRGLAVKQMVIDGGKFPLAFKITQKGQPIHPLYQKANAALITWTTQHG